MSVVKDSTVGYDGPGDAAAYERHADGTGLIYLFAAGPYLTHSSSGGSRWGVASVDGDLVGTTDQDGVFTPNAIADEYGRVAPGSERLEWLGTHRRFAADTISGLVRMGVRLYDPALGRFLQTDPVEGGSCNDYVCGDSANGRDLDGRNMFWDLCRSTVFNDQFRMRSARDAHLVVSIAFECARTAIVIRRWAAQHRSGNPLAGLWHSVSRNRFARGCAAGVVVESPMITGAAAAATPAGGAAAAATACLHGVLGAAAEWAVFG